MRPAFFGLLAGLCPLIFAQRQGVPTFGTTVVVPGGLVGTVYPIPQWTKTVPYFQGLHPVGVIYTSSLNVTPRDFKEGFPGVTDRFEWFAIDYNGRFWIEKPGWYRFALTSDDGALLYIDDRLTVNNDFTHPPETAMSSVKLNGGIHRIRVSYFQGPRWEVALILQVAGPGEDLRIFSTDEFKPPPNPETWVYTDTASADSTVRLDLQASPATASQGDNFRLEIVVRSRPGQEPIALSWNLVVPAEIVEIVGNPQSGSGKLLRCAMKKDYLYFCTLSGDVEPLADGVFATIHLIVLRDAQRGAAHFRIEDAEATLSNGRRYPLAGAEATLTIP